MRETGGENRLAALDGKLLAEPLEFILADHLRQRDLCRLLEKLATELVYDPAVADGVADHLANEMATHILDEEEDLFPLLRRRSAPDDDIERVLGLLSREHARDDRLADTIVAGLRVAILTHAATLDSELRMALREFAYRQRRHLAVENAIVMPLAETRLTAKDREGLARRMAVRRGLRPRSKAET